MTRVTQEATNMSKKSNPLPPAGMTRPQPPSPPRAYGSWDPIDQVTVEMRKAVGYLLVMEGGYKIHIERHATGELTIRVRKQEYTGIGEQ
jgi:hypothetical protein